MKIKFALVLGAIMTMAILPAYAHHTQTHHKKGYQVAAAKTSKRVSNTCSVYLNNENGMTLSGGYDQEEHREAECGKGAALKIGPSFNANSNMELASYVCDMTKPVNPVDASGDGTLWYLYCTYKGVPGNFGFDGIPIKVIKNPG